MSSSASSASSSRSDAEFNSPRFERRRRLSSRGSESDHQYGPQRSHRLSQISVNEVGPLEQVGSGNTAGSQTRHLNEQTSPEPHRDNITSHGIDQSCAQIARTGQSNVDRKRRLTNSAHNSGRVRTVSGGFHSRNLSSYTSQPEGSSSADLSQVQRHGQTLHISSRPSSVERALPALPPIRRHSSNMRQSLNRGREIILPKWQPDSEVSECPICSRQFTFWFRKHHCRKCGRVVCANCSPHRITIPRQFIVHPPESTHGESTIVRSNPLVVDLTGEDGSSARPEIQPSWANPQRMSNPSLGGGEEVRLCNPCVPDPQPSPQATMDLAEFLRQGRTQNEVGTTLQQPQRRRSLHLDSGQSSLYSQHLPPSEARELRRQRGRGMIVCTDSANLATALIAFTVSACWRESEHHPDQSRRDS